MLPGECYFYFAFVWNTFGSNVMLHKLHACRWHVTWVFACFAKIAILCVCVSVHSLWIPHHVHKIPFHIPAHEIIQYIIAVTREQARYINLCICGYSICCHHQNPCLSPVFANFKSEVSELESGFWWCECGYFSSPGPDFFSSPGILPVGVLVSKYAFFVHCYSHTV